MRRLRLPPYLLLLFLPVLGISLLAGGLNFASFLALRQDHQVTRAEQLQQLDQIGEVTAFNKTLAAIQRQVHNMLEAAAAGRMDEADSYRVHSQLVNQLADLEQRFTQLRQYADHGNQVRDALGHFQEYRNFIIQATDLAVVDPPGAMRHAYQAANQYLQLSEHTRAIVLDMVDSAVDRDKKREQSVEEHTFHTLWIGAVLAITLILFWVLFGLWISRDIGALSDALHDLAGGQIHSSFLRGVEQIGIRHREGFLHDLAQAVLAFRDAQMARQDAQYQLGERMKELSCLYEVTRLCECHDLELEAIFTAVVARLPAAMRFPGQAYGVIVCGGQQFGTRLTTAPSERLSASFPCMDGQTGQVCLAYQEPWPQTDGPLFLDEERQLIEAIAAQLATTIERRRIARAERENQELLRAVIDEAPYAIELTDAETLQFIESNQASYAMLGYSREEKLALTVADIQADITPEIQAATAHHINIHGIAKFEAHHRCRDGRQINVEVSVRPIQRNGRDFMLGIWRDITAEKAALAEVRKLSLVVEQSPSAVVICDLNANIEYVNDAFVQFTGYPREEVIGRNPRLLQSGKTPRATYQSLWETLSCGETWRGEFINRTRDGREILESAIIIPLRQPDGNVTHYVAVKDDITAHRRQEDQLRMLFAAVEQSPESIAITDLNARIEYVNAAFMRNTGYKREDVIGKNPRILQSGKTPGATYDAMWTTLSQGQPWSGELINRRKDGTEYTEMANIAPIRGADGIITHYLAIKEDITERKRMSDELARYRDQLEELVAERTAELIAANEEQQALFNAATAGILFVRERRILRCNRALERIFGYTPGEALGQTTRPWYPDEATFLEVGQSILAAQTQQGYFARDMELLCKDGSRFWARVTARAIDLQDMNKGIVGMVDDISIEHAAMLEMQKARALAEDAARMKSDFLANMSHEIRTPMNAIIGMTYLTLKTELTTRQHDYLLKIQSSSQHLLGIINDILDFSKIEAGKLIVEHIDFNLEKMLADIGGLIADKATAKGLELIIDVAPDVPVNLIGDPLRINQILLNYVNNALKFTHSGEIALRIQVEHAQDQEVTLCFAVRDTGIGIDPAHHHRLFRSFEQADTSTTRKYGGTGLGLAISKRLAELMGGSVGIASQPGAGSTFWFTCRLGLGVPQTRRLLPEPDLRGRRVLVVDDNENARKVLGEMLRGMTFEVTSLESGQAALDELTRSADHPYDIVFLDWQMPELNGVDTALAIERLDLPQPPHRVIVTAYGRDELVKSSVDAGIEHILVKPVSASVLFDTAMSLLGGVILERKQPPALIAPIDLSVIFGARILLVEDNELNQEVATEMLATAGLEVDIAAHGAVALRKVQEQRYDLVLMDMQMPVMDGIAATRAIRRLPDLGKLPIVAMTANAMLGDRERCLEAGMNDHIAKPIDPEHLWTTLLRWIEPQAPDTPVASAPRTTTVTEAPDLSGVSGFDAAAGLKRALGRPSLFVSLLQKFIGNQRDFAARFDAALASGDRHAAERHAHTLKGLAAQVGATALHLQAAQLEQWVHENAPNAQVAQGRQETVSALETLMAELAARLPVIETPAAQQLDQTSLRNLCQELLSKLAADDFSCGGLLEQQASALRGSLGDRYPKILEAARDFDFTTAHDLLMNAMQELGIAP